MGLRDRTKPFYDLIYRFKAMNELFSSLLGFFFTVVVLLIFLENCGFSAGCGRGFRSRRMMERLTNPAPIPEIMMQELKSCPGPLAPPPQASDVLEGFATVDASGSQHPQPPLPPMHQQQQQQQQAGVNDHYLEHPIHPMHPHDPMGKAHGRQMSSESVVDLQQWHQNSL